MLKPKTEQDLQAMRLACKYTNEMLLEVEKHIKPNVTTKQLDMVARKFIKSKNARSSFLMEGFPGVICTSVNEQVVHGVPSDRVLKEGDIISVDAGVYYKGFHGDAARTYAVGKIDQQTQNLIDVCKQSFFEGIKNIKSGSYVGDIGHSVQTYAEKHHYGVVRDLIGHGVGRNLHEEPDVPNYGHMGSGAKLISGLTIAVEPMINMGTHKVEFLSDGWTCVTADGLPSAHYENTILITDSGVEILTL